MTIFHNTMASSDEWSFQLNLRCNKVAKIPLDLAEAKPVSVERA